MGFHLPPGKKTLPMNSWECFPGAGIAVPFWNRSHISPIDRIALEAKRERIVARKAKANSGTRTDLSAKLPTGSPTHTRATVAAKAGVGERTYDAGKLVLDAVQKGEIKPDVVEDIRRNKTSIHAVAKKVKETRQRDTRQAKRIEAAKAAPKLDSRIIVGDFRKHADKVADGTVSLIFTEAGVTNVVYHCFGSWRMG